jgi:glyoxylase-like metal-dependent hydrolase (beta-lactamase superfamily II)
MLGAEYVNVSENFKTEKQALLVDPGSMDEVIVKFIEKEGYCLKGILITHNHENHVSGLRSLMRIYNTEIYAGAPSVLGNKTRVVKDGELLQIGAFNIEVISIPGHSSDSVVYKTEHFLFTGDVISAGIFGTTPSPYGAMREIAKIQNTIFQLHSNYIIFPGHGPPSSLEVERKFNISINNFHENRTKNERLWYNLDLLE